MAEKLARHKQYEYRNTSNLVLQAETRTARAGSEPTGEPETLRGRDLYTFGDRAVQTRPAEKKKEKDDLEKRPKKRSRKHKSLTSDSKETVLSANIESGSQYRPRTAETRTIYEALLNEVNKRIGDHPQDVLRGAADEVIVTLKTSTATSDSQKRAELEPLIGPLNDEDLTTFVRWGKGIVDFHEDENMADADDDVNLVLDDDSDASDPDDIRGSDSEESDSEGEETTASSKLQTQMDDEEDIDDLHHYVLDPVQVDAFWLQRELSKFYNDPLQAQSMAEQVLSVLKEQADDRLCESALVQLLEYDKFDFIKTLLTNKMLVLYSTLIGQAQTEEEKEAIKAKMKSDPALVSVLVQIEGGGADGGKAQAFEREIRAEARRLAKQYRSGEGRAEGSHDPTLKQVDLENLAFQQGSHFMSNKQCNLPEGSFRTQKKGYEEFHIPPSTKAKPEENENLVPIRELPAWAQAAFPSYITKLNLLQSRVFKSAFESHENMLVCAPTGAGKTNVALLTMLHEIGLHRTGNDFALDDFKIVYIAPMKSLVREMAIDFGEKLEPYGIQVMELSGDQNLTKQQIHDTQVIITTPEKWDIVTRKSGDRTYTQLVRLIIFDEIHLLHDERGPVLESIIARTIRQIERTQEMVRLVGLSATLPNHQDVATLLRVDDNEGLFVFDGSYRPVPLEQTYVGVNEKSSFKRFQLMNEITYQKVIERAGKNQVLVFVHSRKETGKTARTIRDMALANETLGLFLKEGSASAEILQSEVDHVTDLELKDLLPYGFAIHHAGMHKLDRALVEDLFRNNRIQVLVCTSTLAWGVNLPAHTVIIKGTQVYSPEKGRWIELSPLDVMQMMGRAGRPQFDTKGEGIMITTHGELQYYLSLLNQQLPIESQFVSRLVDNLNAEIVLGTIQNVSDAVTWLGYTYLYICMLRSPALYGVDEKDVEEDPEMIGRRKNLVHSAATLLDRAHLINYDRKSGSFQVTDLGRVASHYYITHDTIMTYNDHLKQYMTDIEIFRLFSLSSEFTNVIVRQEEKQELEKMIERVPIPVKESMEDPTAKVNVLLQVYISRLKLDGFALISDMVYVTQSASRLMRALFEIVIKRGWARLADRTLSLCKMIDRRMWSSQSALRQFGGQYDPIFRKLERKEFTLDRLYDLNSQNIGELIQAPQMGKQIYNLIHQFPRIDVSALVQPITRSMLRVELTLTPDFNWNDKYHGFAESFWIIVEDVDGEIILHHEYFVLKKKYCEVPHYVNFTVPLFEPLAPQYFIKVVSDKWLGSETVVPISFRHMLLPERYSPPTELLDLQPLPVKALANPKFEAMYDDFEFFNPIQTQVFHTLYSTDENTLVCAPTGSGKTIMAEFAILRMLTQAAEEGRKARCVYVVPHDSLCKERFVDWREKFESYLGHKVVLLTGEAAVDLKLLDVGTIVISSPKNWDRLSRRWKMRKGVQNVNLFIADEVHLLGGAEGHVLEAVISRTRYISSQLENKIRLVALSTSLANARDVGSWIGATSHSLFNFRPHVRPVPLEIHIQGFDQVFAEARHLAMYRPTLMAIEKHGKGQPVLIFVSSRKEAFRLAGEIRFTCQSLSNPHQYRKCEESDLEGVLEEVESKFLRELLSFGIGVLHQHMNAKDREVVLQLYASGAIQILIGERTECWGFSYNAHLVVIMGTQFYDGKEHRYVDYPVTDILQMMGKASRPKVDVSGVCTIFCYAPKKQFYLKFLHEPLPIESHFDHFLSDHFNAEIVTKTIENKQDAVDYLTWTFLYRCLTQNPNYYNLQGVSHRHLSDHLSELVENSLNDLEQSNCISIEQEMDLAPLNLGMIAGYYYINYTTIELFASSLTAKTKMKGLIEVLSSASEFNELPIRRKEAGILQKLARHVPLKIDKPDFASTHTKANILLQCYFSRRKLSPLLQADQKFVVENSVRLLQAMVDVITSNRWLGPALAAMELSQMVTQAVWDKDSNLKQIPHFDDNMVKRCEESKVETVFDLMEMEDEDRQELLSVMSRKEMVDVARMCNDFPSIELGYEVLDEDDLAANRDIELVVNLEREMEEEEGGVVPPVHAPYFPGNKAEGWWLVVCDVKRREVLRIKRITLQRKSAVKLLFQVGEEGERDLTLYFMCDSYTGCDQEYEFSVKVGPPEESSEEEDSDEEMED